MYVDILLYINRQTPIVCVYLCTKQNYSVLMIVNSSKYLFILAKYAYVSISWSYCRGRCTYISASKFALHIVFYVGGLPRAWSTPSLGPNLRTGLKPPLLQQAAFDDLIFKVDVMRNVASRQVQNPDEDDNKSQNSAVAKWSSLPILNMTYKDEQKNGEDAPNADEGLQEVIVSISMHFLSLLFKTD